MEVTQGYMMSKNQKRRREKGEEGGRKEEGREEGGRREEMGRIRK